MFKYLSTLTRGIRSGKAFARLGGVVVIITFVLVLYVERDELMALNGLFSWSEPPKAATRNLPCRREFSKGERSFPESWSWMNSWRPPNDSFRYFQPINDKDVWVYSAFFVQDSPKMSPFLIGIGLSRKSLLQSRVFCLYHSAGEMVDVRVGNIHAYSSDQHDTPVVPAYVKCPFPDDLRPKNVSFTFNTFQESKNSFHVVFPKNQTSYNFTVCHSVLHSSSNLTLQLIWSIEMNRLLGAEHFFVYNFSVSPETDSILRYYSARGLMTVLQWPLPTIEAWYFSQITTVHDCLHRNKHVSHFTAFTDTDELIIPHDYTTWTELLAGFQQKSCFEEDCVSNRRNENCKSSNVNDAEIKARKSKDSKNLSSLQSSSIQDPIGAFIFRNVFFFHGKRSSDWERIKSDLNIMSKSEEDFVNLYRILPLSDFMRSDTPFEPEIRSKLIVRPETVTELGIHHVVSMNNALGRAACVSPTAAQLHHYRDLDGDSANTVTTTAFRYKTQLLKRFKEVFEELKK